MEKSFIIDKNMRVALGNCIRVRNVEKSEGTAYYDEPDVFVCVQVENETGENEYCILLDEKEFEQAKKNGIPCGSLNMVAGRIYPKFNRANSKNYFCVKMKDWENEEFVAMFEIGDWSKFYTAAINHPKSCTCKSFLTDILD